MNNYWTTFTEHLLAVSSYLILEIKILLLDYTNPL